MKEFEIKNDLAEMETLTEQIAGYYRENGFDEAICYEVRLALEEAISNTIKYGYGDREVHTICVRAGFEISALSLEIEDDAKAFNPLEAPEPNLSLPVEQKPIGRLGIYLMRSVMDQIHYQRNGTKNILRMIKNC
ncbi:MAG TPA: ATP-binding protein [Acidobacteriota bacterium]|nr:ATP-binding protein [Acidobacteriota bacterium]